MELKNFANEYVLGNIDANDLPTIAIDALVAGYDTPSLRLLAGERGGPPDTIRKYFCSTLQELQIPMPSELDAARFKVKQIVENVVGHRILPYEGARSIWRDIYTRFPKLIELKVFVGLASEYEDDPKHRDEYEKLIVETCVKFLKI